MTTKALAYRLVRRYGTRDPAEIAKSMGYILIDASLKGVRGFYQYVHRCHIIYLDSRLPDRERRWVCAHELGHSLLHKGLNRVFMDACTIMVAGRYEWEADRFAADLIFDDNDLRLLISYPIPYVARQLGTSYKVAEYLMSNIGGEAGLRGSFQYFQ